MKRTDITEIFPEATKEQIDKLMGINGADINSAKAEVEALRQQVTATSGKASLLSGETEEVCAKQADEILAFAQPKYPSVKDSGEVSNPPTNSTRDKFAAWASENI